MGAVGVVRVCLADVVVAWVGIGAESGGMARGWVMRWGMRGAKGGSVGRLDLVLVDWGGRGWSVVQVGCLPC